MPCDLCIKLRLTWVEFTVELALKGVLYTRLASKGFFMRGSPPPAHWPDEYAILMSPYKGKTVSIAATAGVIWLCACVRYRPYRGVGLDGLLWKMIFLKQIKYF